MLTRIWCVACQFDRRADAAPEESRATRGRFSAGAQVAHRLDADHHLMTNRGVLETIVRGAVAVVTAVLTGAGAGAALARKPLLVPVQQQHQRYGRVAR